MSIIIKTLVKDIFVDAIVSAMSLVAYVFIWSTIYDFLERKNSKFLDKVTGL